MSAKIVEINFFPTWSVPEIVAQQDLIPKISKDPSYFSQEHFMVMRDWDSPPLDPASVDWNSPQVVSYKFRQEPGTFNALGVVRINMPNKYSVYMHDTPLKQLFGQSARAFSSGCVRVEKVQELVAWLLGGQKGWTLEKVQAQIDSGKKLDVKLATSRAGAFRLSDGVCQPPPASPSSGLTSMAATPPSALPTTSRMRSSPSRAAPSRPDPSACGQAGPARARQFRPMSFRRETFPRGRHRGARQVRPPCIKRVTIAWDSPMRPERLDAAPRDHQERPGANDVRAHQAAHR